MALLPIVIVPHAILRQTAKPIGSVTKEIERLLDNMLETMYDAPGIGLAAPQIGQSIRAAVVDLAERAAPHHPQEPLKMINPEIIGKSDEQSVYDEGCLSIPGVSGEVTRPKSVRVRFTDATGKIVEIEADGLLATCIQHEIDHLNGVLFIDYLSKLKRDVIMRKMKKLNAERESDQTRNHNL